MTGRANHVTEQARIMPVTDNNKSYMNSRESKNRGHPPFLGGIGIEIPSLYTSPHSSNTKFSDKNCHTLDLSEFFPPWELTEKLRALEFDSKYHPENFSFVERKAK